MNTHSFSFYVADALRRIRTGMKNPRPTGYADMLNPNQMVTAVALKHRNGDLGNFQFPSASNSFRWPNAITLINGKNGMDRSVAGISTAVHYARLNQPVVYVSLEKDPSELVICALAEAAQIPYEDLFCGLITREQFLKIEQEAYDIDDLPIHFLEFISRDIESIGNRLLQYHQINHSELIIIDFVQLLEDRSQHFAGDVIASVSRKLRQIQRHLETPLIELSQPFRVGLEAGLLESDASLIIDLKREKLQLQTA